MSTRWRFASSLRRSIRLPIYRVQTVVLGPGYAFRKAQRAGVIEMGAFSYGSPAIHRWDSNERIVVGKFCSIADGVSFVAGGNHRSDWVSTFPFAERLGVHQRTRRDATRSKGPIIVGNDVWIGRDALILSGVNIGNGGVVAAGTVVTKDVRPYAIVGGSPAREIRRRFSDEDIDRLERLRWWDRPLDDIEKCEALSSESVDDVCAFFGSANAHTTADHA